MSKQRTKKPGNRAKIISADYGALLSEADEHLWGAATRGRVEDEREDDALAWVRRVFDAYDKSCRAMARDFGWSDAWRQRFRRLALSGEGRSHLTAMVIALAEGLWMKLEEEFVGDPDSEPDLGMIRGVGEESVKARIRWFINKFYGGIMSEASQKAGLHVSYVHHVTNPNKSENLTDSFVIRMVTAGARAQWLYTGEGEPTWKDKRYLGKTPVLDSESFKEMEGEQGG